MNKFLRIFAGVAIFAITGLVFAQEPKGDSSRGWSRYVLPAAFGAFCVAKEYFAYQEASGWLNGSQVNAGAPGVQAQDHDVYDAELRKEFYAPNNEGGTFSCAGTPVNIIACKRGHPAEVLSRVAPWCNGVHIALPLQSDRSRLEKRVDIRLAISKIKHSETHFVSHFIERFIHVPLAFAITKGMNHLAGDKPLSKKAIFGGAFLWCASTILFQDIISGQRQKKIEKYALGDAMLDEDVLTVNELNAYIKSCEKRLNSQYQLFFNHTLDNHIKKMKALRPILVLKEQERQVRKRAIKEIADQTIHGSTGVVPKEILSLIVDYAV